MGCVIEKNTGLEYDPRYTPAGMYTDQYSLRLPMEVYDTMRDLPHYTNYGPSVNDLAAYKVSSWNRATLSWSLQCEAEGQGREVGYNAAATDIGRYTGYETFRNVGIAICVIYSVVFCIHVVSCFVKPLFLLQRCCADLAFFIMAPIVGVAMRDEIETNSANLQKIQNFEVLSKCADEYTFVDTTRVGAELEEAHEAASQI
mmetsp:Transcript_105/g.218  ORF Transcript_105/g.218 Transcript_105/m.218 type:complete len:201 (+) Transcript_105:694-1296(+)|eukprot:CAMPEP_0185615336 /NCGR_PEP_ID=MMETSP0436-20130131/35449_1 /TAXON_ID=626734 ORGANISM="Favella taraikaensis, Strain Fe Narragansett Bay" /NCGR_SAMPLE_ID=MMETSP0436 /ASSEMBLY_ACC=CAM_ASM_000390 /LENGTH=200 /DNA_ID=CAMNT_0028250987 /DNA_START=408 /DNA_END=1010 /DNA_ORIENTATION=-